MSESVQEHRRRLAARGFKRIEIALPAEDAELIRTIAKMLVKDDDAADELRAMIQRSVPDQNRLSFEDWLKSPD
jgi:hypothetical protein